MDLLASSIPGFCLTSSIFPHWARPVPTGNAASLQCGVINREGPLEGGGGNSDGEGREGAAGMPPGKHRFQVLKDPAEAGSD